MNIDHVATELVDRAAERGHAVLRCNDTSPVDELRTAVRQISARRGVHIRTGMITDVLAVVLADADLWDEPVSVMRAKLPTPITFNTVH